MLAEEILHQDGGKLGLGARGEKLYGFRNFTELYAVFSTPRSFTVLWGLQEIGSIDADFVEQAQLGQLTFILGARAWCATDIDWSNGVVRVEPVEEGKEARWLGRPRLLGEPLCRAMREVLSPDSDDPSWSQRARSKLSELRQEHASIPPEGLFLQRKVDGYRLWTFAGGRANNLLAKVLEDRLGGKVTSSNLYLNLQGASGKSQAAITAAIEELRAAARPNSADALRFAASCARGRLSKFEPCLTDRLAAAFMAETLTDAEGAAKALGAAIHTEG
jgi:ATP-dependent Lhr-like helicase